MSENIKERLLEIIEICKAKYNSPESIAALQKTFQSHNITIEDWNSLIEYVKTAIDTGNDLIEIIDLIGEYVVQTVEDKMEEVDDTLALKVDKTTTVNGHPLSTDITLSKSDIGLGNVDNTSDVDKPISTATQAALDLKADKEGPLPKVVIPYPDTPSIGQFLDANNLWEKTFIFDWYIFYDCIARFVKDVSHNTVSFEIERVGRADRYVGSGVDSSYSISHIFMSNTYRQDYEIINNKVKSTNGLSASSTDTQYPSAKLVYDLLALKENKSNKVTAISASSTDTEYPSAKLLYDVSQNVREVAEGKCKSVVIDTAITSWASMTVKMNSNNKFYIYNNSTKQFDSYDRDSTSSTLSYYKDCSIANSLFKSQTTFEISSTMVHGTPHPQLLVLCTRYPYGELNFGGNDFRIIPLYGTPPANAFFKTGDIIYILQLNYPDRWIQMSASATHICNILETTKVDLTNYTTFSNINTILGDVICGLYDNTETYAVGDIVIHNNKLYKCTTAITVAENWDATHWTQTNLNAILNERFYTKTQSDSRYALSSTTIAGIALSSNITAQDLTDALVFMNDTTDIDYVMED